uniref:CHHC U11-48K-type domain-containing protein n=1 Tax=Glossina brevipalpis TaxID=37001 RepID=A0A1A9W6T9_9MUSC
MADPEDDMVECPYNKSHRMLRKRLAKHLVKCRVHYPDTELKSCPFNSIHLVSDEEFEIHAINCPDRKLITEYKSVLQSKLEDGPKQKPVESDENWDTTEVTDYDPKKYLGSTPLLQRPDGTCPSERKAFIKNKRKRLGYDENNSDMDYTSCSRKSNKRRESEKKECTPPPAPIIKNWPGFDRSGTTSTSSSSASRRCSSSRDEQTKPSKRSSTTLSLSDEFKTIYILPRATVVSFRGSPSPLRSSWNIKTITIFKRSLKTLAALHNSQSMNTTKRRYLLQLDSRLAT